MSSVSSRVEMLRSLDEIIQMADVIGAFARPEQQLGMVRIRVNTTALIRLGYGTRKEVMRAAANRVGSALGPEVSLVHQGSDDFTALSLTTSPREFEQAVQRVSADLSDPYRVGDGAVHLNAVVGAATLPVPEATGELLLEQADVARFDASEGWGIYAPDAHSRAEAVLDLTSAMAGGMNKGEFYPLFQPIVYADGTWAGAEALVRWNRPGAEFVGPDQFIPAAENSGFIHKLGLDVLEQACATAMRWSEENAGTWPQDTARLKEGLDMPLLSVNVAAPQLEDPAFAKKVLEVLERTGFPAEHLQLELTEGTQVPLDSPQIYELNDAGVRFTVDDFGTQASNFDYIQAIARTNRKLAKPLNIAIKLDRELIGNLDRHNRQLLRPIVQHIRRELPDAEITAEGIEDPRWIAKLARIGCTKFQGFGIGRPESYGPPKKIELAKPPVKTASRRPATPAQRTSNVGCGPVRDQHQPRIPHQGRRGRR